MIKAACDALVASFIHATVIQVGGFDDSRRRSVCYGNDEVYRLLDGDVGYLQMEASEAQSKLDDEPVILIMDSMARAKPWNVQSLN